MPNRRQSTTARSTRNAGSTRSSRGSNGATDPAAGRAVSVCGTRYVIDCVAGRRTEPGGAPAAARQRRQEATVIVVGCGGTGGFLAEALCRLLMDVPAELHLVDMDRIEPHNCGRQ